MLAAIILIGMYKPRRVLNKTYFHHTNMIPGGRIVFEMGPTPNKQWGAEPGAAPPSVTPILMKEP